MAAKVYTTAQLTTVVMQLQRQVSKLTKIIRNHVVDDDSGSFQSMITSQTGGKGSVSGSWSAEDQRSWELSVLQTSGTGSASLSIPDDEGFPGV